MAAFTLLASVALSACVAMVTAAPVDSHAQLLSKYDNFDVERVLGNDRILSSYLKCLMEQGACTSEGRDLKKTIPDALAGGCSQCTQKQKQTSERVINHLKKNKKSEWDQLLKKYDPQGLYEAKLKQVLSSEPSDAKKDVKTQAAKDVKESTAKNVKEAAAKDVKATVTAKDAAKAVTPVPAKEKSRPAVKQTTPAPIK